MMYFVDFQRKLIIRTRSEWFKKKVALPNNLTQLFGTGWRVQLEKLKATEKFREVLISEYQEIILQEFVDLN